uniref:Uncharacterized protein n=1 Tax=Tetranychus urticae TaxID=32264 RepID=T1JR02_TETUR
MHYYLKTRICCFNVSKFIIFIVSYGWAFKWKEDKIALAGVFEEK